MDVIYGVKHSKVKNNRNVSEYAYKYLVISNSQTHKQVDDQIEALKKEMSLMREHMM